MLATYTDDCGAEASAIDYLQWSCDATRGLGCIDTVCPDGGDPRCDGMRCSNNCSSLNFDGWCDDGDTFNTSDAPGSFDSALCPWGTDCADCGTRNQADDEPINIPIGGQCHFDSVCKGHRQISTPNGVVVDLQINASWCIQLNQPVAGNYRCVPDASGEGEACPEGYDTVMLRNGTGAPIMMDGLTAKACVPAPSTCE